jgi:hypothetical protein
MLVLDLLDNTVLSWQGGISYSFLIAMICYFPKSLVARWLHFSRTQMLKSVTAAVMRRIIFINPCDA